jgi:tRNA_anti-like
MQKKTGTINAGKWLQLLFAVTLLVSFFLPWVVWDSSIVTGSSMPMGGFFKTSEEVGGPANPFPELSFSFFMFWLIPVLAALTAGFVLIKRKTIPFVFFAGALSLALVTVFFLFTNTLIDLGIGKNVFAMLKPGAYIHAFSAFGIILTAFPVKNNIYKLIWLIIGPVIAFGAYKMGEKYIMGERFEDTVNVKADYTVNAIDLIREFAANDTAANKKYREKILAVNGIISQVEKKLDSTVNIKFIDTTRHFLNFSLDKKDYLKTKSIKAGDNVSLKGSCSGSDYSLILDSTSISFKRATINKK